jgi:hypothetical protein
MAEVKPLDMYQLLELGQLSTPELRTLKDLILEKMLDIHESLRYVDNEMAEIILEERQKEMMHKLNIVKLLLEKRRADKKN